MGPGLPRLRRARAGRKGVLHSLEASRLAASLLAGPGDAGADQATRELDHMLAAMFGFWELVLPAAKRFKPRP